MVIGDLVRAPVPRENELNRFQFELRIVPSSLFAPRQKRTPSWCLVQLIRCPVFGGKVKLYLTSEFPKKLATKLAAIPDDAESL